VTTAPAPRRSLHVGTLVLVAVVVGVGVALVARATAAGSCPAGPEPGDVMPCGSLVASLAWRVGAAAAGAVMLFGLLSIGLARTSELMRDDRRRAAEEDEPVPDSISTGSTPR